MKKTIEEYIEQIESYDQIYEVERWQLEVKTYLESQYNTSVASRFFEQGDSDNIFDNSAKQKGYLKTLIDNEISRLVNINGSEKDLSSVFIVHGHDTEVKERTARFVEKIGLKAIILHEQANRGRTIIEKIESYSNVGFAIVLYTSDDLGKVKSKLEDEPLKPRPRQNVIFEHGYLMGKIGRENVIPLVADSMELPNDISGMVYISDKNWQLDIAKEMKDAGYVIDLNKLL